MKKKLVAILLIVVIVFNFILCNCVYADLDDTVLDANARYGGTDTIKTEAAQSLVNNGTDSNGNSMNHSNFGLSFIGVLFQYIAAIIDIVPIAIHGIMSIFTANPSTAGEVEFTTALASLFGPSTYHYTIERTVFNEIAILNSNVFNQDDTYEVAAGSHSSTINQHNLNLELKKSVAGWFYSIRLLAMMINLCVLIYVGIRMAVTTIASEEAKYKKMLIWWAESMLVLFFLHYIMYAIMYIGDFILDIINTLRYDAIATGGAVSFEDILIDSICMALFVNSGTNFFLYSIFFWFIIGIHTKFLITYVKRMFTIFFLVVISPLITVTYPIDKLGNGRAEAYEMWYKELMINILIQPIHAIVYLVFVYTAGKIAEKAPFIAMVFLLSLGRIENIVRNVFKITDSVDNVNMARKGGGKGGGLGHIAKMFLPKPGN